MKKLLVVIHTKKFDEEKAELVFRWRKLKTIDKASVAVDKQTVQTRSHT